MRHRGRGDRRKRLKDCCQFVRVFVFFCSKISRNIPPIFFGGVETEVGQTAFSGVGGDICQEGTARSSLFRSTNHGYLQACALDQKKQVLVFGWVCGPANNPRQNGTPNSDF